MILAHLVGWLQRFSDHVGSEDCGILLDERWRKPVEAQRRCLFSTLKEERLFSGRGFSTLGATKG